jgi:hypothetical protein
LGWLRGIYGTYPKRIAALELLFFLAVLVSYLWVIPFWYWGIYRLDLVLPDTLSQILYEIWLDKNRLRALLVIGLVCMIALSIYLRSITLREMGIRADNLWKSACECLLLVVAVAVCAGVLALVFNKHFSIQNYWNRQAEIDRSLLTDVYEAILSGIAQQFLLQSFLLLRTITMTRNRYMAVAMSSVIFAMVHFPNVRMMLLTVVFGSLCNILFLRNKNIFTLGVMHGLAQQILRIFFTSMFIAGNYHDVRGYYEYNLRVGPPKGYPAYLAGLKFEGAGTRLVGAPQEAIFVPVSVTNKSTRSWSSTGDSDPIFLSYRLLDAKGRMLSEDTPLTPLPNPIEPGASEEVKLKVSAPSERGDYTAEVDIVVPPNTPTGTRLGFSSKGSKTILIPISVR